MQNNRISTRERGLIKGALRRVFSRSDLRRDALAKSIIEHSDPKRPRVTKWSMCPDCKLPSPTYLMQVDHINPVVPLDTTMEQMDWNDLVNNLWCDVSNLVAICKPCHKIKTGQERRIRLRLKKEKLLNEQR